MRPGTAARVAVLDGYQWRDSAWQEQRASRDWLHQPLNVYEVHAGSWKRHWDGRFYNFRELADNLVPYVQEMGFTHIELMPISEHPLDESWGYQTTGYFGVTSRFGTPDDFRYFVDTCHVAGIGVILDWVPAHFPKDSFALARFDGTALYEHEDPRLGEHQDWGTLIFNYGRNEVRNFLLANAHYLAERIPYRRPARGCGGVHAVSRLFAQGGPMAAEQIWRAREHRSGGFLPRTERDDARAFPGHADPRRGIDFVAHGVAPDLSGRPGLLHEMEHGLDERHARLYRARAGASALSPQQLTFGQLYNYTENFMLPFSHDEVVHGKHSLLDKMPGDPWQKFANLRLLFTYQMTYPGKKLNFMGNEFAQGHEWKVGTELDWYLLGRERAQRGAVRAARPQSPVCKCAGVA